MLDRLWPMSCNVELSESPSEVSGYNIEYYGRWLDAPLYSHDEGTTCAVAFTLPTEYLIEHGPAHVRSLALKLARELPFTFGYASLALVAPSGCWYPVRRDIRPLLSRYLGLDLYHLRETIQMKLPFPDVSLLPLDGERALLTLG